MKTKCLHINQNLKKYLDGLTALKDYRFWQEI